jgi:hypothetical protein
MKQIFKKHLAMAAIATAVSFNIHAATDGLLAATSEGDLTITADITDFVMVTGLDDIYLGSFDPVTPTSLSGSSAFCVYRNGTGAYNATLSGSSTGPNTTGFYIASSATSEMAYTVTYDDGSGAVAATDGTAVTGLIGNSTETDCAIGGDNATIQVDIADSVATAAETGNYTGLLTVLISPE